MNGDELHVWVGGWLKKAASLIVWNTPINQSKLDDFYVRCLVLYESHLRLLRQISPCYCVLPRHSIVCSTCPLRFRTPEQKRDVRQLVYSAVILYKREMRYFPEYKRDKSPDYNDECYPDEDLWWLKPPPRQNVHGDVRPWK